MDFRHLGTSGLKISEITYGNWLTHGSQIENDQAKACVRAALEAGISTFDTGDAYASGDSERLLGRALGGDRVEVRSSGSQPADAVNPAAVEAMAEVGINMGAVTPRVLTREDMEASDVVVTMGCGDECPYVPGVRREDWVLADPAGQPVEAVRPVRDEIRTRVEGLLRSLGVEPVAWPPA